MTSDKKTPYFQERWFDRWILHIIIVGAGGTGARVMPPLMQMLRPGDAVSIIDHDIVEDRNLIRQHFTGRDIGQPKALVLRSRYQREGIISLAFQQQLTAANAETLGSQVLAVVREYGSRPVGTIIIGCVDNAAARRAIYTLTRTVPGNSTAWIDVGNEMRAGQVLLSLKSWSLKVTGPGLTSGYDFPVACSLAGLQEAMPQLLRDDPTDTTEGCAQRMDLQTVQVNHMAAAAVINVVSWLILGIPFTSCGAFFSTLNTMQPIRIAGISGLTLLPETTYAISA